MKKIICGLLFFGALTAGLLANLEQAVQSQPASLFEELFWPEIKKPAALIAVTKTAIDQAKISRKKWSDAEFIKQADLSTHRRSRNSARATLS